MSEEQVGDTILEIGKEILDALAHLMPEKSFSFSLNEDGMMALQAVLALAEEKMPKNMTRLREAIGEALGPLAEEQPGVPLNVNFSEEEIRALAKTLEIVEREIGG